MRRPAPALLAPVVVLLLAGCGGGDGADDAKADYVSAASAVRDDAKSQRDALVTPTTPAAFAPYVDALVELGDSTRTKLDALAPPEADRAQIQQKVLDPLAAQVEEGKAYAEKVRAAGQDQAALLTLLQNRPGTGDIDLDFLRSYGLESCVNAVTVS